MKFLILSDSSNAQYKLDALKVKESEIVSELRKLYDERIVEVYVVFKWGGAACILNVNSTEQLSLLIRSHPLFVSINTKIIPVADAEDFLKSFVKYI